MSEEQLKAFLEKVKGDTSLQEKFKAAPDSDAVVVIATQAGFTISADDLKSAQSEISEEELEAAAGGWIRRSDTRCFGRSITGDGCLGPTQEVGCKK